MHSGRTKLLSLFWVKVSWRNLTYGATLQEKLLKNSVSKVCISDYKKVQSMHKISGIQHVIRNCAVENENDIYLNAANNS